MLLKIERKEMPMRERKLITYGSFCDTNLYQDGAQTVAEAKEKGRDLCPNYEKCKAGFLETHACIMIYGLQVARESLKSGSVAAEMRKFRRSHFVPRDGWVYSLDRKEFTVLPGGEQTNLLVEQFAHVTLGDAKLPLSDQADNPRIRVGDRFEDVVAYATRIDPRHGLVVDLRRIDELEGRFGYNGGRGCDVISGPCSCGAWH